MRVGVAVALAAWVAIGPSSGTASGTAPGTLSITSDPAGATVYLDGQVAGVTPLEAKIGRAHV